MTALTRILTSHCIPWIRKTFPRAPLADWHTSGGEWKSSWEEKEKRKKKKEQETRFLEQMSLWRAEYFSFTAAEMMSALPVPGIPSTSWDHPYHFYSLLPFQVPPLTASFIHSFIRSAGTTCTTSLLITMLFIHMLKWQRLQEVFRTCHLCTKPAPQCTWPICMTLTSSVQWRQCSECFEVSKFPWVSQPKCRLYWIKGLNTLVN